jgi:hypothetical protein
MESWLPPGVPADIWNPQYLLHYECTNAASGEAQFVFGAGDTKAYSADMDVGLVWRVTVWCDGLPEAVWVRDYGPYSQPTAWQLISQ